VLTDLWFVLLTVLLFAVLLIAIKGPRGCERFR